jgi:hypothetical protein
MQNRYLRPEDTGFSQAAQMVALDKCIMMNNKGRVSDFLVAAQIKKQDDHSY